MERPITISTQELENMLVRAARLGAEQFHNQAQRLIPEKPYTKAEAAAYLGCSIATIDRYMSKGLPFEKRGGGHPKFYKSQIDAWSTSDSKANV